MDDSEQISLNHEVTPSKKKSKNKLIGKSFQIQLLIPLISVVIISSIIVIGVVFTTQKNWLSNTEDYIKDKEFSFMLNYLTMTQSLINFRLSSYSLYLRILASIFQGSEMGILSPSPSLQSPVFSSASNFTGASLASAEWFSSNSASGGPDSSIFQIPDAFLRTFALSLKYVEQLGFLTSQSEDLIYLYPGGKMRYIHDKFNYSDTCNLNNSEYRLECTESYYNLYVRKMNLSVYYENSKLFIMEDFSYNGKKRAVVGVLDQNYINTLLQVKGSGYTSFVSQKEGLWTLAMSNRDITEFSGNEKRLSYVLFPNSTQAQTDFSKNVLVNFKSSENDTANFTWNGIVNIDSKQYAVAVNNVKLLTLNTIDLGYRICVMKAEKDFLKRWHDFTNGLYYKMIIISCIFSSFVVFTLIIAWRLALIVTHRISIPINLVSSYLSKGEPNLHSISPRINSQINTLIENLIKIEEIEKFIDPKFLLHPNPQVRLKNLEEAYTLFESLDNKKGVSITLNLMGNIHLLNKSTKDAEKCYRESLRVLEELLDEIKFQEKRETLMTDKEKEKIGISEEEGFWDDLRHSVVELIATQCQQIAFAMTLRLKEHTNESTFTTIRNRWKEVINFLSRSLQHYQQYKENCFDCLNLLIDMAEIYQILHYYHTAKGLLNLVYDELNKIDLDKISELDIDAGRLRKLGIEINESTKTHNFLVTNVTFEKDVLLQKVFYRNGLIYLEKEAYGKAARSFRSAITKGAYFDPDIRKNSTRELLNLFKKFRVEMLAYGVEDLNKTLTMKKKNVVFGLAFNVITEEKLSSFAVTTVKKLIKDDVRFGAVCKNNISIKLDLCERDMARMDLENLIIQSREIDDDEHIFDLLVRGAELFNVPVVKRKEKKYFIVLYKKGQDRKSIANLEVLYSKIDGGVKLLYISLGESYSLDFEIFVENLNGDIVQANEKDIKSCEMVIQEFLEII